MRRFGPGLVLIALSAAVLSGCGGGGDGESTPASGTAQPAPPPPSGTSNHAPTISGSAPQAVNAASAYSFVPTAADADGDTLTFSIENKPDWAAFDPSNGRLSGTPTDADVGTYSNIVIAVSDGHASTALNPFSIAVTAISNGTATLSWTAPTQNTDGSVLSNLAGYRIRYGKSAAELTSTIDIANPSVTTYVMENLAPATWYFAVTAVTSTGTESAPSNVASKTVDG